jgi:phosphoribosyl-AMP cyclohydrolase
MDPEKGRRITMNEMGSMEIGFHPPVSGRAVLEQVDFEKAGGLVPAVVQASDTGMVLMLAWVSPQALEESFATGYAHYFSRSRNCLWKKGETSGNQQRIREILLDCDGDTLLYIVDQKGPACHTGTKSCFFRTFGQDRNETGFR